MLPRSFLSRSALFALCLSLPLFAQSPADKALLAKTRALYDTPFQHGLISFDCAVEFDWTEHFRKILGTVPPAAQPVIQHLQAISHRIFVDRSGATVSTIPKPPDLTTVPKGPELENLLTTVLPQGLNAWIPSSTDVLLPRGDTVYSFEKLASGYKLAMSGTGLQAELVLDSTLHINTGVVQQPQPMRFDTIFQPALNGLVLSSIRTGQTTDAASAGDVLFSYTYQPLKGFEIPQQIGIAAAAGDQWTYTLSDCKVVKGIMVELAAPPRKVE